MKEISIGILIPTSNILPMGKQFDRSFKKAIKAELEGSDFEVEFNTEMIGQGNPNLVENALDQFFGYHDVNFVTGLFTSGVIGNFVDKFEKRQVPLLMNNLGEHYISSAGFNEYVLVNSAHLWQQSWALGYFAAENLGKKGLILGAMFDGGYAFLSSFQNGLMSFDEDFDHQLKLIPMPEPGKLSDVKAAFDAISIEEYDFVFPLFCGEEATLFLEEFHARKLHDQVKLVALPFLLETGSQDLTGIEIYSTLNVGKGNEDVLWKNTFSDMGEKSGKAIGQAILTTKGQATPEVLNKVLSDLDSSLEYVSTRVPRILGAIEMVKHEVVQGNEVNSEKVGVITRDLKDDPKIQQLRDALSSVWMNSYLAV